MAATFNPGYRNAHDLAYAAYCISEVRLSLVPPRKFVVPVCRFDCRKFIYIYIYIYIYTTSRLKLYNVHIIILRKMEHPLFQSN